LTELWRTPFPLVFNETLNNKNLYLNLFEKQRCGKCSRLKCDFLLKKSGKNGSCGDYPIHGSNKNDGSELKNENENRSIL